MAEGRMRGALPKASGRAHPSSAPWNAAEITSGNPSGPTRLASKHKTEESIASYTARAFPVEEFIHGFPRLTQIRIGQFNLICVNLRNLRIFSPKSFAGSCFGRVPRGTFSHKGRRDDGHHACSGFSTKKPIFSSAAVYYESGRRQSRSRAMPVKEGRIRGLGWGWARVPATSIWNRPAPASRIRLEMIGSLRSLRP